MRINPLLAVLAVGVGLLAAPASAVAPDVVHKTATLPEIGVSDFQNTLLPGSVEDDRGVLLGGIGSGLFPLGANEYWTVTDRGPNGEVGDARTFLVPGFTPTLVRVKVQEPDLVVREAIPITTPGGDPVTGLANLPIAGDPLPYAADA